MPQKITELQEQLETIIKGKKEITDKILMAVLAKGHVLLEDVPGVGKTTTALALSRLMGMDFNRIQFTPDVVPSDVTGFTMYDSNGTVSGMAVQWSVARSQMELYFLWNVLFCDPDVRNCSGTIERKNNKFLSYK